MKIITARQLKLNTDEFIKNVKTGESFILTYQGKPIAVISSQELDQNIMNEIRPFDEAWKNIENTLEKTEPKFEGWEEATAWISDRT
ncbi:Antitoxin [Candidatus Magnetomoraceae bacterium gMMP-15]